MYCPSGLSSGIDAAPGAKKITSMHRLPDMSPDLMASIGPADPSFVVWETPAGVAPSRVVAAVPHAGRRYPPELLNASRVPLDQMRFLEDACVDLLATGLPARGIPVLVSCVARAFVDLNRAEDELDPLMFADWAEGGPRQAESLRALPSARVAAGLGCLPRIAADGRDFYRRKLTRAEARARLDTVYRPYHQHLARRLAETHAVWGEAILLDLHSMPSRLNGAPVAADFVLGNRHGASCAEWVTSAVEASLQRCGFRVARNMPYAGGHVTQLHGQPHRHRHALQVEVSRALYLDETRLRPTAGVDRVRQALAEAVSVLTGLAPPQAHAP